MRDIWQTTNVTYGANFGLATVPKKLDSKGINKLLFRVFMDSRNKNQVIRGTKET